MSLILDALRKSEEQRRLGQPPSLADEAFLPYPRARVRSSRSAFRYVILLLPILSLVGIGMWWAKRETAKTEQGTLAEKPVVGANAKQVENAALPTPTARGAFNTNTNSNEGLTQKQNVSKIQNQNQNQKNQFVPPIPAPIKQAQTATLNVNEPKPFALKELTPPQGTQEQAMRNNAVTPNATSSVLEKNVLEHPPINQNKNDPMSAMSLPSSTPDSRRVTTVDATPAMGSPTDISQTAVIDAKPLTDHRANIIPYIYELPLQVRQSLPAFKVTMRVYDPDPSKRFAIINDLRVAEGVNLDNGMKLIEIGPEDITLEHVGQRFRWSSNGY